LYAALAYHLVLGIVRRWTQGGRKAPGVVPGATECGANLGPRACRFTRCSALKRLLGGLGAGTVFSRSAGFRTSSYGAPWPVGVSTWRAVGGCRLYGHEAGSCLGRHGGLAPRGCPSASTAGLRLAGRGCLGAGGGAGLSVYPGHALLSRCGIAAPLTTCSASVEGAASKGELSGAALDWAAIPAWRWRLGSRHRCVEVGPETGWRRFGPWEKPAFLIGLGGVFFRARRGATARLLVRAQGGADHPRRRAGAGGVGLWVGRADGQARRAGCSISWEIQPPEAEFPHSQRLLAAGGAAGTCRVGSGPPGPWTSCRRSRRAIWPATLARIGTDEGRHPASGRPGH